MKKAISVIAVVILVLLVARGVFKAGENKGTVKIGAAFAMTGDAAPWGEASLNAAKLAVEEINKNGGINGKTAELVLEDTKSTSKDTVTAVSKLQNVDEVSAIAATWLDSFQGAGSVINDRMLLISQDAAIESVNMPKLYPRVFSTWYRTSAKSMVTIGQMKKQGVKKLYIILQNDPYYVTLMDFLKKEAVKEGIEIVGTEMVNPNNGDIRTIITKANSSGADGLFFGSYDSKLSAEFLKTYSLILKKSVAVFGDEFIEQEFTSGDFAPGLFEGIQYYVPAASTASFASKYKEKFGKDPVFSAGTTYDTIMIIARYLKDQPEDIDSYMRSTTFDTITYGKVTFDQIGGVVSSVPAIVMKKIEASKIVDAK